MVQPQGSNVKSTSSPNKILAGVGFGSSAGKGDDQGTVFNDHTAKKTNKLSIPSIPSRFLTPILKFDFQEKDLPNYEHLEASVPVTAAHQ